MAANDETVKEEPQTKENVLEGGDKVHTKEYVQMIISASRDLGPNRAISPTLCKKFVPVSRRPNKPTAVGIYGSENHNSNVVSGFGRTRADRVGAANLSTQKLKALQTASRRVNKVVDWSKPSQRANAGTRQYLQRTIYPMITEGLRQLAVLKPDNPLEWLGKFCLEYTEDDPEVERTEFPE